MSLRPLDTTSDALAAQRVALDELGPEGRVRAALAMSESIRRVRLSGLRARHPDASEGDLVSRFIADAHGVRLDASG